MVGWLTTLLSGKPHFIIGGAENPYMLRWWLVPRNRWFNVYLHKFCRDDDDRALHDHPFAFISLMLRGRYVEMVQGGFKRRRWLSIAFRKAAHRHRVILYRDDDDNPMPCWTLVITGPRVREWGFWCPQGFVPWRQFVSSNDAGAIGRGCGET